MELPNFERLVKEVNDLLATNEDANKKAAIAASAQEALDVIVVNNTVALVEAQKQADDIVATAKALTAAAQSDAEAVLEKATAEAAAATDLRTREIAFLQGMIAGQINEDPTPE